MAATRRLQKELGEIRNSSSKSFRDVQVDESNLLVWQGLLVPEKAPYNKVKFYGLRLTHAFKKTWRKIIYNCSMPSWGPCISIPFVPGCVHNWSRVPSGISVQTSEGLVQDQDLPPQHWWEGPGVSSHRGGGELEARHQDWAGHPVPRVASQRPGARPPSPSRPRRWLVWNAVSEKRLINQQLSFM